MPETVLFVRCENCGDDSHNPELANIFLLYNVGVEEIVVDMLASPGLSRSLESHIFTCRSSIPFNHTTGNCVAKVCRINWRSIGGQLEVVLRLRLWLWPWLML